MQIQILIIDDEEPLWPSPSELLESAGYLVESVSSVETTLDILWQRDFHVVLLDPKLPGASGAGILRRISSQLEDTRLIVPTGHGCLKTAIEALRSGADDYLLKPVAGERLLDCLDRVLTQLAQKQQKGVLLKQIQSTIKQLKTLEGIDAGNRNPPQINTLPGGILVDLERRKIWRRNECIILTPLEGKLLSVFLDRQREVLSHTEQVKLVHGYQAYGWEACKVVRPIISRLRKKMAVFPRLAACLENVRGRGYIFHPG
jgi:DNA-binding response OmpR family regulator